MAEQTLAARRRGGRAARRAGRATPPKERKPVHPGLRGGRFRPLSDHEVERVHQTALDLLENVGMADPIPEVRDLALKKGGSIDEHGRLSLPRGLVEDVIAGAARSFVRHGRDPEHDLDVGGSRVHFGGGGEAITVVDFVTGRYRPSTLIDLYDMARLVDRLDNIHAFGRLVVATDIPDLLEQDINMAYAQLAGTTKSFGVGFSRGTHVEAAVAMFDAVLGGEGRFRKRPFCTFTGCPVVSPLRFGKNNSEVLIAGARAGAPVDVVVAPQAGATAPAALAGALVQTIAETLAGLVLINLVSPGHPTIFGAWPFVTDLRSGAFSGGGGEEAILSAAAVQMGEFYDLPRSVGAGMTDSKLPDSQAGYEKGITTMLAGLAGANLVEEAAGFVSSLLGCSFEGFVIDDDMLGMVQRALRGIEVTDETLSYEVIKDTVLGAGHYLAHPQTLALMETEYLYPTVGDRTTPDEWEAGGSLDIRERARARAQGWRTMVDGRMDGGGE
jgi:trimethylamine--corrinoid protein Co-methyltransferase